MRTVKNVTKLAIVSIVTTITSFAILIAVEVFSAMKSDSTEAFVNPNHNAVLFHGNGRKLVYLVMGDSTAAGRGAEYNRGIAVRTAEHLAGLYDVSLINLGESGAKVSDVLQHQVAEAERLKPDIILLSVGANDITHFTSDYQLRSEFVSIIKRLGENKDTQVVITGSGDLGACPRFAQPLRYIAGLETNRVNALIKNSVVPYAQVTWASLAARTGEAMRKDQSLFSQDGFHPNERGYGVWISVLDEAIDVALSKAHQRHIDVRKSYRSLLPQHY